MRFSLRSLKDDSDSIAQPSKNDAAVAYDSTISVSSCSVPGVTFRISRVSFGRRMDLTRRVREISQKVSFLEAGSQLADQIEANLLAQEIEAVYLRWGLVSLEGLMIDGECATADRLLEKGPEELVKEIVGAVKSQCGLTEAERKN